MKLTTNEESIKVISRETIEDTDPVLYRERAKILAKQGLYDEADKEYDKSIQYSNDMYIAYMMKVFFWMGQGRNIRSIIALLVSMWKFFYRNIDFILLFAVILMQDVEEYGIGTFILMVVIGAERAVRATKWYGVIDGKEAPLKKYRKNVICTVIGVIAAIVCTFGFIGIVYYIVASLFLIAYLFVMFVFVAINVLAMLFRGVRRILPKRGQKQANKVSQPQQDILLNQQKSAQRGKPSPGAVGGVLSVLDSHIQKGKEYLDKFAAEKNIDFSKKVNVNTVVPGNMQQEPKQTDKASPKKNPSNQQEVRQREKFSMGAVWGMLLVLDAPIQRGKLFLDKFMVEKNIVTILVNGNNMQVDVSCKRIETKPDTDLGQCERYDIKKDTVVYVLVAVILYCINIWGKEWDGNTESACEKLTAQLNQKLNPCGVRTRLSEKGWHFLENGNLITFEDVIFILRNKKA